MKIHCYIYINHIDILNRVINNPLQDFNKITLYKEKDNENVIMVSLDYDTYIMLLDQNKVEIV